MKRFLCSLLVLACVQVPTAPGATPQMTYHIETVAGSGRTGDGGPATAAQLSTIQGVAADHLGNLYISDTNNQRIRKISSTGVITTLAGNGTPGYSGDGGPATAAQLNHPYGIAADLAGNVYVADYDNNCVRRIGLDGTITTIAGTGVKGNSPEDGTATHAALMAPRNVAVDGAGNLFISEYEGHRVRRVSPDGWISKVAGTGVAGDNGDGLATNAQLAFPAGLALDRMGDLYVADSGNQCVRKIHGGNIDTLRGDLSSSLVLPQLITPMAVAVDLSGIVFVVDGTASVHRYDTVAKALTSVAGAGGRAFSGDGGPAKFAQLSDPQDLALDSAGNLFIADGLRIRRVDVHGLIQTVAGDGYVHTGDGGPATDGWLYHPSAVALGRGGNLYIADAGTERIRQVTVSGAISTFAGTGVVGGAFKDGVAAVAANLNSPMGVAADPAGNILIADTNNNRIRQVAANGPIGTFAGTGETGFGADGALPLDTRVNQPQAVCLDHSNTVYISDTSNNRILRAPLNGVVKVAAGNGAFGAAGDGGLASLAELHYPSGCALDSAGNLFIADTGNNRIRKVTPFPGGITTVAGTGVPAFSGDEGAATAASLSGPRGVAVDDNGNIFIADTGNNRIRLITLDGVIHTIAGENAAGFAGDGGPATSAQLFSPGGLFLDVSGILYLADINNNRVRRLVPDSVLPPDPVATQQTLTVVNAASQRQGPVAPGEIVSIFGVGMGPVTAVPGTFDSAGLLANLLGGTEVRFNGVPAPLYYAQSAQINAQVPYTVAGISVTHMEVFYQGRSVGTLNLPVAAAAPGLFSVAINQDGTTNSQSAPAARGTILTFFATGEGIANSANISGQPAGAPYPRPVLPVSLSIAGVNAELLYGGAVPGGVGVLQVNARVPTGFVAPGAAAVELTVGAFSAPAANFWLK
jgi:uncharacterized protein (TIGR03437 family)